MSYQNSFETSPLFADQSIITAFERIVSTYPDRPAVHHNGDISSYAELNRDANRVAALLDRKSIQDTPIVVFLPQGARAISSMLGVLKIGGFFLPLDIDAPAERNARIIAASGAQVILTDLANSALVQPLCGDAQTVICFESASVDRPVGDIAQLKRNDMTRPAYVLYTSGSTGEPKGVLQDHGHVLHNTFVHTEGFGITAEDRQSLLYRINVYGGLRDTYNALLNGACLHILTVTGEELASLPEWIANNQITIYCSVTTVFRHLVRCMSQGVTYPSVRIVKLGGEVVYANDIENFSRMFVPGCKLSCGLAMTETGAVSQYFVDVAEAQHQSRAPRRDGQ
ncbi:AMP-binding protein [Yoonia sp. GPGPB17]|uniref:AMP-binding protein n=1 Tax=Yoonia sp. GPGPB17 TaxID=3026147 RepID=UPI0030BF0762